MSTSKMFLLVEENDEYFGWTVISCSSDMDALQAEADRLDKLLDDEARAAANQPGARVGFLERDDPRRCGWRKYSVIDVPVWPEVSES